MSPRVSAGHLKSVNAITRLGFCNTTQQLWPPLLLLQVRIEQVIVADPGAVLLYKLSNLLKFYHHTIGYLTSHMTHYWLHMHELFDEKYITVQV